MKNIFRFLMAVAIIFGAVSCAKEDISSSLAGGEVEVTFTANLPELGTRAYGDGANANLLRYWVYDANGEELPQLRGTATTTNRIFTFTLPLIKGMTYDFVLWADQNVGTLENPKGLYDVTDGIVTVDYTENKVKANDNNRDAFYGFVEDFDPLEDTPKFTLIRPFAQINAATSEKMEDITANGLTLESSSIKADAYTKFDIKARNVVGNSQKVTLAAALMPYMEKDENGNPAPNKLPGKETYTYLAMGYILAPQDRMVSNVTFYFNGKKKGGADFTVGGAEGLTYTNVPLKQNFRTNILGQLLTKSTEITVEIEEDFYQPDTELTKYLVDGVHYEDFRAAVNAALASENKTIDFINDCTLEADETITVPEGNTLILNLNGNTLSCTTKDADKNDDGMITSADNEVVFDVRGTMTIKDGTVTLQHVGADYQNFGWNACGEICYVGFNGVLNVENAHLEHLGGVAMAYTIDLVNAASATRAFTDSESGVLLNVNKSTLNSAYVAVRVFNNGAGMNNVNIVNSNLFGASRAFWVHVFTNTDNGGKGEKVETLNLNIFNTGNKFNSNNRDERLIEFGFADNEFFQVDTNGIRKNDTTLYWDGTKLVASWSEFTTALGNGTTKIMLADNIEYSGNYSLQKDVVIDLNGKSITMPMFYVFSTATIKNGTINGKMYARTGCKATLEGLTFSGTISDNLSTEGHLQVQGSCDVYAKNCTFAATTVNGSQTRSLSIEGSSSGTRKFEDCDFKFLSWGTGAGKYKKNVYINTMNGTTTVDFTNCKLNGKAPNIIFAAAYPLTNLTMSGCDNTAPTLEISRAKDTVTEEEWAHISSLIANNKFTQVRVFYAGGSSEYIK